MERGEKVTEGCKVLALEESLRRAKEVEDGEADLAAFNVKRSRTCFCRGVAV